MKSARRVARPTSTGSTPVASGSSVPAWPTRFWPASLRTLATTSCEVQPLRLLTFRIPVTSGLLMLALLFDLPHQAHDAVASRQRPVEDEFQMWSMAEIQAL